MSALMTLSTDSRLSSSVYLVLPLGEAAARSFSSSWYLVSLWTNQR